MSLQMKGVAPAREVLAQRIEDAGLGEWDLDALAGRLVELSGGGATAAASASATLILEAQRRGELCVWIGARATTFYPPDFAASGIDLEALPVVHVAHANHALRVADALLRSGGFAIMVLDLGARARLPLPVQTRLAGLAKRHNTALLAITGAGSRKRPEATMASLRAESSYWRVGPDRFVCELRPLKDKRRPPGWSHREIRRGPDGLC